MKNKARKLREELEGKQTSSPEIVKCTVCGKSMPKENIELHNQKFCKNEKA